MTRFRTLTIRLLAAAAVGLAGCIPDGSRPSPPPPAAEPVAQPPSPPAVSKAEVFRPPAPTGAADDARVAAAAAEDAIARSLSVVHRRLTDLKIAYETKARTEGDLRDVAERMKPLVAAARTDCDAILRAARDVKAELPHAEKGYAAAAALYRERAGNYRDPAHAAVTRRLADEFDRAAKDAPRKLALTDAFVARLVDIQEFLAETERCLNDTATALKVLSAGPAAPEVSADGRTFRRRLEEFLAVVAAYQDALYPKPAPAADPKPPVMPQPTVVAKPAAPPEPAPPNRPKPADGAKPAAPKPKTGLPAGFVWADLAGPDRPVPPVVEYEPPVTPPVVKKQGPYPGSNPRKPPAPYPGSRRR